MSPSHRYYNPRRGTRAERIVAALRAEPYKSYQAIARKLREPWRYVYAQAFTYGLQRGSRAINPEDKEKMLRLVCTTDLSYAEIGRYCGGYNRVTVRALAVREGLHDTNKRNPKKAIALARQAKAAGNKLSP